MLKLANGDDEKIYDKYLLFCMIYDKKKKIDFNGEY